MRLLILKLTIFAVANGVFGPFRLAVGQKNLMMSRFFLRCLPTTDFDPLGNKMVEGGE